MEGLAFDRTAMTEEWEAWRDLCAELKNCSAAIDINAEPRLAPAIRLWGERLVALRSSQRPEVVTGALEQAERGYVPTPEIIAERG